MLARKTTSINGKPLPADWTESVARLLNETYATEAEAQSRFFDVYGQVYSDELLVIASFTSEKSPLEAPVTVFLSCDEAEMKTPAQVKITQEGYIELLGLFFDEVFSAESWDEWEPLWQEVQYQGSTYFYKISRENIALTLDADRLLREAGVDPDDA